jgi:hypothetical protein
LWCVAVIVMSSAYDANCTLCVGVGVGISCMYRLNSVGERTEPCETPFGKRNMFDDWPL